MANSEERKELVSKIDRSQSSGIVSRTYEGKPLTSQVVAVENARIIFVSGQIARDASGKVIGKGDMRAQIKQVASNVENCLKTAGATMSDVVKMTTYVTDIAEYSKHVDLRAHYFGAAAPASVTVEVRNLAGPDYMVEIEVVAAV
jgi:enamine deaminase RidA (YjgF/YER057c/UK114 family)